MVGSLLVGSCAAMLLAGCDATSGKPTASSSTFTWSATPPTPEPTSEQRISHVKSLVWVETRNARDAGRVDEAEQKQKIFDQLVADELQPDPDGFGDAACATVKRILPSLGWAGKDLDQEAVSMYLGYTVMVAFADMNQTIGEADTDATLKENCPAQRAKLLKRAELKSVDDVRDYYAY
ncbi:hypothetical protein KIH74_11170 [Kineosporia sp. J2-2]|uniref:Lipoprotein n=1 Tax=Kineosporia corallincola TaxID=2835133 RepID=A0ABS5TGH5_9ACTN|nr:hypothetical protein [Kineosporia corallincola]MBT0769484.1 hypothetical protein [Kineosporia corallincola]